MDTTRTRSFLPFLTVVNLLASGCTLPLPANLVVPSPTQDLSAPEQNRFLTLDLRESAGITVDVEGEALHLMLFADPDSLLVLDRDVADRLDLPELFFGLTSAYVQDGDYTASGRGVRARYSVAGAEPEKAWAIVMDEDIHPDYDGAISFGAIPARVFRVLLGDDSEAGDWRELVSTRSSEALERERDYDGLEFNHELALYQDPISANRKAAFYLRRAGRLGEGDSVQAFTRLFGNERPYRRFRMQPPLIIQSQPVQEMLIEVDPDGRIPGAVDPEDGDVVVIHHDRRRAAYAPTIYLGRDYFARCHELEIDKSRFGSARLVLRARCEDRPPESP